MSGIIGIVNLDGRPVIPWFVQKDIPRMAMRGILPEPVSFLCK